MLEIIDAVMVLANKLGQTTESLWIPFINYQKLDGISSVFGYLMWGVLSYYVSRKFIDKFMHSSIGEYWPALLLIIPILIFVLFFIIAGIQESACKFIEPQGFSVKQIINNIGSR